MYALYQKVKDGYVEQIFHEPIWHGEEGYDGFEDYQELRDCIIDNADFKSDDDGNMGYYEQNFEGEEEFFKVVLTVLDDALWEEHFDEQGQLVRQSFWELREKEEDEGEK